MNKSNEDNVSSKTNRLLKLIYESVVQETIDFVGIILLIEKVIIFAELLFFYIYALKNTFQFIKEATAEPTSTFIQQMKLVESFYKSLTFKTKTIITQEFLFMTLNTLENKIRSRIKSI